MLIHPLDFHLTDPMGTIRCGHCHKLFKVPNESKMLTKHLLHEHQVVLRAKMSTPLEIEEEPDREALPSKVLSDATKSEEDVVDSEIASLSSDKLLNTSAVQIGSTSNACMERRKRRDRGDRVAVRDRTEDTFEVERILNVGLSCRFVIQFLATWTGFPDITWELFGNFDGGLRCPIIKNYIEKHRLKFLKLVMKIWKNGGSIACYLKAIRRGRKPKNGRGLRWLKLKMARVGPSARSSIVQTKASTAGTPAKLSSIPSQPAALSSVRSAALDALQNQYASDSDDSDNAPTPVPNRSTAPSTSQSATPSGGSFIRSQSTSSSKPSAVCYQNAQPPTVRVPSAGSSSARNLSTKSPIANTPSTSRDQSANIKQLKVRFESAEKMRREAAPSPLGSSSLRPADHQQSSQNQKANREQRYCRRWADEEYQIKRAIEESLKSLADESGGQVASTSQTSIPSASNESSSSHPADPYSTSVGIPSASSTTRKRSVDQELINANNSVAHPVEPTKKGQPTNQNNYEPKLKKRASHPKKRHLKLKKQEESSDNFVSSDSDSDDEYNGSDKPKRKYRQKKSGVQNSSSRISGISSMGSSSKSESPEPNEDQTEEDMRPPPAKKSRHMDNPSPPMLAYGDDLHVSNDFMTELKNMDMESLEAKTREARETKNWQLIESIILSKCPVSSCEFGDINEMMTLIVDEQKEDLMVLMFKRGVDTNGIDAPPNDERFQASFKEWNRLRFYVFDLIFSTIYRTLTIHDVCKFITFSCDQFVEKSNSFQRRSMVLDDKVDVKEKVRFGLVVMGVMWDKEKKGFIITAVPEKCQITVNDKISKPTPDLTFEGFELYEFKPKWSMEKDGHEQKVKIKFGRSSDVFVAMRMISFSINPQSGDEESE